MSAEPIPAEYHHELTSKRADLTRLGACWREFRGHFSPRAVAAASALVVAGRLYVGQWSWRDLAVPLLLLCAQPFVEWVIHKYLLHLKPISIRGRRIELYGSIQHRRHHGSPSDLDRVLLKPVEVVGFLAQIAVVIAVLALVVDVAGGGPVLAPALTGLLFAYVGLFRYEWSHFLIHTPYVPRSRWYRSIWRNHRLHHFKHEDYWMGVSSNLGDRLLGTNPDQKAVLRSPTARTLGVETE
jgi:sterol desaturase/sphingolipid hydroxylase (fatty acid hydroxylase superfamily)